MKNIIFIAPPAAGKGTQSDLLKTKYDYNHISTGDMLREEIASGSELGLKVKNIIDKGELVTDDVMIDLLKNKLSTLDGKPFILDGFPRTLNQAIALNDILNVDYVAIYLEVDREVAMKRIVGRLTCKCGKSYNIYDDDLKPKVEGICDKCGEKLTKRDDDNEESFNVRFDTFLANNEPILEFYKKQDKLRIVNVDNEVDKIFEDIEKVI